MKTNHIIGLALLGLSTLNVQLSTAFAQGTAFTYQGRLGSNGVPVNGTYDLLFTVYASATGSNDDFANYTNAATVVSNGLFTVTLDFGAGIFNGPERWLEIAVRTNGGGSFTTNSPRQKITATPYAITAGNLSGSINAGQLSGTISLGQLPSAVVTNNQSGVNFTGTFAGNGAGVTNVSVSSLRQLGPPVVVAWGDNGFGQTNIPAGLSNVIAIAGIGLHSLALKSDGTVVAWGNNDSGQTNVPAGLSNVMAIAGGSYHSLALKSDGKVVAWGDNFFGQTNVPAGLNNVMAVAAGGYHNLALRSNGTVVAWGRNVEGQANVPASLSNVMAIAAGGAHNLALKSDGTVVTWGHNNFGQVSFPFGLSNVTAIAAGGNHSLALKSDGTAVAWGWNLSGQTSVPAGLNNVMAIAGGGEHSLALKSDGTVVAWGNNSYSQTTVPVGLSDVTAIAGGLFHSLALRLERVPAPIALLNQSNVFQGTITAAGFAGNGGGLINVNALTLGGVGANGFWRTGGNAGTTPGPNFLGTTDNQPLEIKVNNARALRLEPHGAAAPSLVGGYFQNSVASYHGAAVAGGGTSGSPNYALGNYAFVGAGHGGQAADYSAVVAGAYNVSPGLSSFIGSGEANTNSANYAFIGGGTRNSIQPNTAYSVLGGGQGNSIQTNAFAAFLGGGQSNSIEMYARHSFLGGGYSNLIQTNAYFSFLGGGNRNSIRTNAAYSVLGGGFDNSIQATDAVLGGGRGNSIQGYAELSFLGGGLGNSIQTYSPFSVVGGGYNNLILPDAHHSVIGGGGINFVLSGGEYATIPGGRENSAVSYAFAAGRQAKANHQGSFVWADSQAADFYSSANNDFSIRASGGVRLNTLTEALYIAPAGNVGIGTPVPASKLEVQGAVAAIRLNPDLVAIGSNADGYEISLVGGVPDGTNMGGQIRLGGSSRGDLDINAIQFKQNNSEVMRINDGGNVGIGTYAPAEKLHVVGNIRATGSICANNGVTCVSDRNAKRDFAPVNGREVLEKVAALPLSTWSYIADPGVRHVGPMAQDFRDAFAVGVDEKSIATVDADGVALAAIQGLNQKLDSESAKLREELKRRDAENVELKQRLEALERIITSQTQKGN